MDFKHWIMNIGAENVTPLLRKHLPLFQNTKVWFPASRSGSWQPFVTIVLGNLTPSFDLSIHPHTLTYKYTHTINKNKNSLKIMNIVVILWRTITISGEIGLVRWNFTSSTVLEWEQIRYSENIILKGMNKEIEMYSILSQGMLPGEVNWRRLVPSQLLFGPYGAHNYWINLPHCLGTTMKSWQAFILRKQTNKTKNPK